MEWPQQRSSNIHNLWLTCHWSIFFQFECIYNVSLVDLILKSICNFMMNKSSSGSKSSKQRNSNFEFEYTPNLVSCSDFRSEYLTHSLIGYFNIILTPVSTETSHWIDHLPQIHYPFKHTMYRVLIYPQGRVRWWIEYIMMRKSHGSFLHIKKYREAACSFTLPSIG